jgi:hypothetical protein
MKKALLLLLSTLFLLCRTVPRIQQMMEQQMMPFHKVRHLAGDFEELPCLQ